MRVWDYWTVLAMMQQSEIFARSLTQWTVCSMRARDYWTVLAMMQQSEILSRSFTVYDVN
jgi:hypothetical protein